MYALLDQREPFVASEVEAEIAGAAAEKLRQVAAAKKDINIVVKETPNIVVPLPARAVEIILDILVAMKHRTPFSIIPGDAELTTQQAADYLNVSRPYLVKMLDKGELAHRLVGRHRRVKFADIRDFEQRSRKARRAAISEMIEDAEDLGLE